MYSLVNQCRVPWNEDMRVAVVYLLNDGSSWDFLNFKCSCFVYFLVRLIHP